MFLDRQTSTLSQERGLIFRARIRDVEIIREERGLSFKVLEDAGGDFSVPTPLPMTAYGMHWALNPVVLLDNAVRRECNDLRLMVRTLMSRALILSHQDVKSFFQWFCWFRDYALRVFQVEEEGLYFMIESRCSLDDTLLAAPSRDAIKRDIINTMQCLSVERRSFSKDNIARRLVHLQRVSNRLVDDIERYLREKESHLPSLLKERFSRSEADTCEMMLIQGLARGGGGISDVILSLEWMRETCPRMYSKWLHQHPTVSLQVRAGEGLWLGGSNFRQHMRASCHLGGVCRRTRFIRRMRESSTMGRFFGRGMWA
mmetsp:Transcript_17847/g.37064  ORF Transcript_17847/g.37064 Transcript_17847/m.37064 type:complete len:315 (+) Transcript_17847:155-1099(+)